MQSGNFILILHTHLPWVLHHGKWPHGADWLTEAVAECYIPLLNVFNDLMNENIYPKVTIDISPVLCEQLEHPDFEKIFEEYCIEKIEAARKDAQDFKRWGWDAHSIYLANWWAEWYEARLNDYKHKYNKSIIKALKELQDNGAIEIMTCGATHGYLPLLGYDRSINLQIEAAVNNYKKHFGREPRGIWLPECAYRPSYEWQSFLPVAPFNQKHLRPGIEQFLSRHNLKYFVIDQKLIENSYPIGKFQGSPEHFVPINSPAFQPEPWNFDKSPLRIYEVSSSDKIEYGTSVCFARHRDIAMQVWSGEVGYPGEPDYLDFHKRHFGSMLRYWRVTDVKADMQYKAQYHPDWVWKKLDLQANHFIHNMENTSNYYFNKTGKFATLCVPFDTELFGHWWFEGPEFLRYVLRGLHHSPWLKAATASEQLFKLQPKEVIGLPEGSWGVNNNHDVWSNPENVWTWQCIYDDEVRLKNLFDRYPISSLNDMQRRIALQALRELMLLHSSDWQFLIYTKSAKDYAESRFFFHNSDFNRLCDLFEKVSEADNLSEDELSFLEETEKRNSIFPELKLEWWNWL